MSKPGRPPSLIPTSAWKIRVPNRIQADVDLRLLDPLKGKVRYGLRGKLVALLLQAWLDNKVDVPDLFGFDEDSAQQAEVDRLQAECKHIDGIDPEDGCPHCGFYSK